MRQLEKLDAGAFTTNQPEELRARLKKRISELEAAGIRPRGYGVPDQSPWK